MKPTRVQISFLLIAVAWGLAPRTASAQQSKVLLEDKKVLVTSVEVNATSVFTLPSDQPGTVWIALDSVILVKERSGVKGTRLVRAGYAAFIRPKEQVALPNGTVSSVRLIVVKPKNPTQALTLEHFLTGDSEEEDASDRDTTLIVAASDCSFRYIRYVGEEYAIRGKKKNVTLSAGEVIWIPPGMYNFKNLGPKPAKLVSIEF
jgi:hypothetical protein